MIKSKRISNILDGIFQTFIARSNLLFLLKYILCLQTFSCSIVFCSTSFNVFDFCCTYNVFNGIISLTQYVLNGAMCRQYRYVPASEKIILLLSIFIYLLLIRLAEAQFKYKNKVNIYIIKIRNDIELTVVYKYNKNYK